MPADVLVPLTLVVGDEELFVGRAVSAVVRAAREADPDVDVRDVVGTEVERGDLDDMLSPSLFGERRVLVVRGAQDLAKDVAAELQACAADLPDDVHVVVVHAGGAKGKALLTALTAMKPRKVDAPRLSKPAERRSFVRGELRSAGRAADEDALSLLLDAVGEDLRQLASAVSQLVSDTEGHITADVVRRFHQGHALPKFEGFNIADRAVEGDLGGALELVRWGQSTGLDLVLVTSGLASTLRGMALVASAGRAPAHQVAGQLGMPAWKVEKIQKQARGWRPEGLTAALTAVAEADADVKGASADADYGVERLIFRVVQARGAGR